MQILDKVQIEQKIERLAFQIYENNYNSKELYFAGINNKGLAFAKLLAKAIEKISKIKIVLVSLSIDPASPLEHEIKHDFEVKSLNKKNILVIDDVANTGRTLFYAFKAFNDAIPAKIEVAVLVDRKHKNFPIKVDYVGLSLATTIKENIRVELNSTPEYSVYLD